MKKLLLLVLFWTTHLLTYGQTQMDLPVTFNDPTVEYDIASFGGAEASVITVDPTDANNTVVEFVRSETAATFAGVTVTAFDNTVDPPFQTGLASNIPLTADATTMSVRTWSPDAGIPVMLKIEDKNDPTRSVETLSSTTVANDWETLVFDFSNERPGTAALNLDFDYNKVTIFFDFDTPGSVDAARTYYFDDIEFGGESTGGETYNVTFQVNMNDVTEGFTTPEVNGAFNGFCGGCAPMSDLDGDGIWSLTIPLEAGTYEYKYAADNWNIQETLEDGSSCTSTIDGFVNRTITVSEDAILDAVCWGTCDICTTGVEVFDVVFQVNMNDVTEGFTTPEVNGTFNGFCGGCAPMSDLDGDGIWSLTIPLEAGTYEYKYAADNWNIQETLEDGSSCTITIDGFVNRTITVSGDQELDPVCWGTCDICDEGAEVYNVTFQVDMNNVTETFTTPELNGTFNGFCGACAPMSDVNMDGVWEITVELTAGDYEYKFSYDEFAGQENLLPGSECTLTTGEFTNRTLTVSSDSTLAVVCWESCVDCESTVPPQEVTFQVDMNEVTDAFTTPELFGSFNGFCSGCNPLSDDDADGVWSTTISLLPGTYEYKFAYDNLAGQEELTEGASCTSTIDGFTNRTITVGEMPMTLDVVCWESCVECSVGLSSLANSNSIKLYPNPAGNTMFISGLNVDNADVNLSVFNAVGKLVYSESIQAESLTSVDVSNLANGVYSVELLQDNIAITKKLVIQH